MEALRNNLSTLQPSHSQKNRKATKKRARKIEIANRSCFETRASWFYILVVVSLLAALILAKTVSKVYVDLRARELDRKASLFKEQKKAQRERDCELMKKTVDLSIKNFKQLHLLQELKGELAHLSNRC